MTVYRLAHSPKDYAACHALLTERATLSWPTIVAERDGSIIGFLATQPRTDAIVAGPLAVRPSPGAAWTLMRLIDAYEAVLRLAGVTSYRFFVERANARWTRLVAKLGLEPLSQDDTHAWYERRVA